MNKYILLGIFGLARDYLLTEELLVVGGLNSTTNRRLCKQDYKILPSDCYLIDYFPNLQIIADKLIINTSYGEEGKREKHQQFINLH